MGIFTTLLISLGVGAGLKKAHDWINTPPKEEPHGFYIGGRYISKEELDAVEKRKKEERKATPVVFKEPLTKEVFEEIAIKTAKPIKRLTVTIEDQFVHGYVNTISGLNSWEFCVDYNDFENITGKYWMVFLGNSDSRIPDCYAEKLKVAIQTLLKSDTI